MRPIKKIFKHFLLLDIIKSLKITQHYFFRKNITLQVPKESTPRSERFRGTFALRSYPNNDERCIACHLCEKSCPSKAITIKTQLKTHSSSLLIGESERTLIAYDIDLFKCIFCGFCVEACPVDAIVQTQEDYPSFDSPHLSIMNKATLLKVGKSYDAS
jgi:NADH-quinone oxidoreductase subunit I